jgi:hypothetical protein
MATFWVDLAMFRLSNGFLATSLLASRWLFGGFQMALWWLPNGFLAAFFGNLNFRAIQCFYVIYKITINAN